jgi:hypothetical protein
MTDRVWPAATPADESTGVECITQPQSNEAIRIEMPRVIVKTLARLVFVSLPLLVLEAPIFICAALLSCPCQGPRQSTKKIAAVYCTFVYQAETCVTQSRRLAILKTSETVNPGGFDKSPEAVRFSALRKTGRPVLFS